MILESNNVLCKEAYMNESLDEMERIFLALSDKTRIKLIDLISDGEVSVNFLCESLGVSQPKVSRHLAYLRAMGMVNTRREGKWIYYSLSWPESQLGVRFFRDTLSWIASISGGKVVPIRPVSDVSQTSIPEPEFAKEKNIYQYANMRNDNQELEVYLL